MFSKLIKKFSVMETECRGILTELAGKCQQSCKEYVSNYPGEYEAFIETEMDRLKRIFEMHMVRIRIRVRIRSGYKYFFAYHTHSRNFGMCTIRISKMRMVHIIFAKKMHTIRIFGKNAYGTQLIN